MITNQRDVKDRLRRATMEVLATTDQSALTCGAQTNVYPRVGRLNSDVDLLMVINRHRQVRLAS